MQTLLVAVAFALAVCYLYHRLRRALSGRGGCGCSGCSSRALSSARSRSGALVIPKYERRHNGRSA
ncbi:FeoB-associated Cys-rich membrane protein [Mailhella sp.]|uniref:FeoB-associated Cys-rich membrane protein n=1 Tax=Mailhella sp. TaxID=1981029 RepID=UPI0040628A85